MNYESDGELGYFSKRLIPLMKEQYPMKLEFTSLTGRTWTNDTESIKYDKKDYWDKRSGN